MASWMIHLRVADTLLSQLDGISGTEFIMGNIAPDSGVPNDDWSKFTPGKDISHFFEEDENSHKRISIQKYINRHFTKEMQKGYSREQYSFYLGYLVHLMTDILWVKEINPI
ncbi:MAG: zinc dependent phospholipase C family protein, partial [Candidatus Avispirillum sp.]